MTSLVYEAEACILDPVHGCRPWRDFDFFLNVFCNVFSIKKTRCYNIRK